MIIPWMSLPTLACSPVGSGPCSSVIGNHSYQDYLLSTLEVAETSGNYNEYIKNNASVTVNNDFFNTSEVICQWFSRVTSLANHVTSDEVALENHWQTTSWVTKKSLFMVTNVLFHFLHTILCPHHTILHKTIINHSFCHCRQRRIFPLSIVTSSQLICDVMPTWVTSIVTSSSSIVLAGANWHKGDLH